MKSRPKETKQSLDQDKDSVELLKPLLEDYLNTKKADLERKHIQSQAIKSLVKKGPFCKKES